MCSSIKAMRKQQQSAVLLLSAFLMGSCLSSVQAARALLGGDIRILAIGDSITEGSVPSKGYNHPYTNQLKSLLQQRYPGTNIIIDNKGVGGSGIYAVGFNNPTTVLPVAMDSLQQAKNSGNEYDYTIVLVGINDLMRVGKSADDVMSGLNTIYEAALNSGSNVIAIPPFGAPGFVSRDDYKEGERKKLAQKIQEAAAKQNSYRYSPRMLVLDLQAGPMSFYDMPEDQRKQWLDDGLHFTQHGYDQLASHIANAIASNFPAPSRKH